MLVDITLLIAACITTLAYVRYFRDIQKDRIVPNRWSWLIWSTATLIEALTYQAVNEDLQKSFIFFLSAVCCVAVCTLIWKRAIWKKPERIELLCLIASIAALTLWLAFSLTLWAHLLIVAVLPLGFYPTWKSAFESPEHEYSSAWGLWTIGDLLTLAVILIRYRQTEELPYIFVELSCHAFVWLLILRRSKGIPSIPWGK